MSVNFSELHVKNNLCGKKNNLCEKQPFVLAKKNLVALAEKKLTRRLRVKHQFCVSYAKDLKNGL